MLWLRAVSSLFPSSLPAQADLAPWLPSLTAIFIFRFLAGTLPSRPMDTTSMPCRRGASGWAEKVRKAVGVDWGRVLTEELSGRLRSGWRRKRRSSGGTGKRTRVGGGGGRGWRGRKVETFRAASNCFQASLNKIGQARHGADAHAGRHGHAVSSRISAFVAGSDTKLARLVLFESLPRLHLLH